MLRFRLAAAALLVAASFVPLGCSSTAGSCVVDGKTHAVGEHFSSADGCNGCTCSANGTVACTLSGCAGTGGGAGTNGSAGTSASGGTNGGAGTSASAGTGGGAGTDGAAGVGGQPGACALTASYTFRDDGGLRAGYDESKLTPARTHSIERISFLADAKLSCARDVPCTSTTAVTVPAIAAAISNADVQAALAKPAGMVYGTDSRPIDGTVWMFERADGKGFFVGAGNAVPAGLRALETLLRKLDDETILAPECAALRAR